ncbi:hypothetical protein I5T88_10900 [Stenotrophomonas maltophilia]|nr:hypothetical protein [Stenotrophomonas maltophilia]
MTYTLAQIRGYTAAAAHDEDERERARVAHFAQFAEAIRMAMWADQSEWRAYQDSLIGKAPAPKNQGTTTHG